MSKRLSLKGHVYGELLVLRQGMTWGYRTHWHCLCSCGELVTAQGKQLQNGHTQSCGHLQRAAIRSLGLNKTHGHFTHGRMSPTYTSWSAMKTRCDNPNHVFYHRYGGRGITYCERWARFEAFLADMGERPHGLSIDRINNDGNYEPGNCRWATQQQQVQNRGR